MKTQNILEEMRTTSSTGKRPSWVAGLGAFIVVALIVSISAFLFAQLTQHHDTRQAAKGQWVKVLDGYTLTSLVAAQGSPDVLYACAAYAAGNKTEKHSGYTILRSSDAGVHWKDISIGIAGNCQLAVNPADSNDVYVASRSALVSSTAGVLRHSTNGGQTWNTITPAVQIPGLQAPIEWHMQQISMVGSHLFGLESVPLGGAPQIPQTRPGSLALSLPRLFTSVDGGHVWKAIDNEFHAAQLEVRSYVVDTSNPNVIYLLVGRSSVAIEPAGARSESRASTLVPPFGANGDLYKTTTGGAQWQPVLKSLPFGSVVQLASSKPGTIYVGGSISPLPSGANGSHSLWGTSSAPPSDDPGSFHVNSSRDGGATWREITPLPQKSFVQTWIVSPDGRVFAYSSFTSVHPAGVSESMKNILRVYDPASNTWKDLPVPQTAGTLLAATAVQTTDTLWFADGKGALYRYIL